MSNRFSTAIRFQLTAALLALMLAPAAHAAGKEDGALGLVKALAVGPLVLLIAVAAFAALCLFALGFRRVAWMADISERALRNTERGRALQCLWGLLFALFIVAATAVLINIKPIALLGILLLCAGAMLAGWGAIAAAAALGRPILSSFSGNAEDPLAAIRVGLPLLFFVSVIPFLGWGQGILAVATGMGAVLEAMVRRD